MTRRLLIKLPSSNGKLHSLLPNKERQMETTEEVSKTTANKGRLEKYKKKKRFGEVAGGTAAECAAVCCCCPCTLMNLLILAIFKIPACLCRKAKKRHRARRRKKKQALLGPTIGSDIEKLEREVREAIEKQNNGDDEVDEDEIEAVDLEKEMWERFYGTGFWRSPSQRCTI